MVFKSVNPKNGKLMKSVEYITNKQLMDKVEKAAKMFRYMKNEGSSGLSNRFDRLDKVKLQLKNKR